MKPYAQEAEKMRLSFLAEIASPADVAHWADQTLVKLKDYDDDLVALSLCSHGLPQEIYSKLIELKQGAEPFEAVRYVAGKMADILSKDKSKLDVFIKTLNQIWEENDYQVPKDLSFINAIEDEFFLIRSGTYGNLEEAVATLIQNLQEAAKAIE